MKYDFGPYIFFWLKFPFKLIIDMPPAAGDLLLVLLIAACLILFISVIFIIGTPYSV